MKPGERVLLGQRAAAPAETLFVSNLTRTGPSIRFLWLPLSFKTHETFTPLRAHTHTRLRTRILNRLVDTHTPHTDSLCIFKLITFKRC